MPSIYLFLLLPSPHGFIRESNIVLIFAEWQESIASKGAIYKIKGHCVTLTALMESGESNTVLNVGCCW